jgi:replication factor C subunit 1
MANAADMISLGDEMNIQIRQNQNWGLLPNYGIFSSVAPCLTIKGNCYFPSFPQWLGKNSSQRKSKRLIRELKFGMAHRVSAGRISIQNEMVPLLLGQILRYLKNGSKDSVLLLL